MTLLVIFLGTYLIVFEFVFVFWGLYKFSNHKIKDFSALLFALILGFLIARFAGLFYSHLQPFVTEGFTPIIYHVPNNSFPSDHVIMASAIASSLFFVNKKWGIIAFVLAILISVGRVLGGIHYEIDVIVGLAIGILVAIISMKIFKFIRGYSQMGEQD